MDLLQTCAVGFHQLLTYQYHIVAGRKGRTIDFTISFDPSDFHHLAGLHKLTDNVRFLTGKRANIMQEILSGNLTLSHAQRSVFFKQMEPRLKPLAHLEEFLDSNEIVFRYNSKVHAFSAIQADYLLQNSFEGTPVYLFLARRMGEDTQVEEPQVNTLEGVQRTGTQHTDWMLAQVDIFTIFHLEGHLNLSVKWDVVGRLGGNKLSQEDGIY